MPELPEVETMRRGVLRACGGVAVDIRRTPCRCKPIAIRPRIDVLRRRIVGRRVEAVERIGKRVLLRFDTHDSLVFEPRMTGLVLTANPPNKAHLRLELLLQDSPISRIAFWDRRGLGSVYLLTADERVTQLGPPKLGPDALEISAEALRLALRGSRRAIKTALLDQRVLAGVGNLYASEILHVARVHPAALCCRLRRRQWEAIHAALRDILNEAIRHEGSTLSDGTYRNALNKAGGYQVCHRVYAKEGQLCPGCGLARIKRTVQTQRATFFCPACQKR